MQSGIFYLDHCSCTATATCLLCLLLHLARVIITRMRLHLATMALLVRGGAGLVSLGRPAALARLGAFGLRHASKVPSSPSPWASASASASARHFSPTAVRMSTAAPAGAEMPPVSLLAGFLGTGKSEYLYMHGRGH